MTRRIALVSILIAALPSPVHAGGDSVQFRQWINQCMPGTSACISFGLRLEYDASLFSGHGGTRLALGVTNHQGALGYAPSGPFGLSNLSWTGISWTPPVFDNGPPEGDNAQSIFATSFGNAGITNPTEFPTLRPLVDRVVSREASVSETSTDRAIMGFYGTMGSSSSVFGCDAPVDAWTNDMYALYGWLSTCGNGSITFTWNFMGEVAFTRDTQVTIGTTLGSCTVGVDCYTVPEPASLLLLATGLLGLAVVRRQRPA